MSITSLQEQLLRDEREVLHAYTDSRGYLTIGVGRLIDARGGGISHAEAMYLLDNDIRTHTQELVSALPWVADLDPARLGVLCNMAFNMGVPRLLGFKHALKAIQAGNWSEAAKEMLDSAWARQVGGRAERLAEQMRTGEWQ